MPFDVNVVVPENVVGQGQAAATAALEAQGITVIIGAPAYSPTVPVGDVISQGAPVAAQFGTTVTLTVSLGVVQGGGGLSLINNFGFAF